MKSTPSKLLPLLLLAGLVWISLPTEPKPPPIAPQEAPISWTTLASEYHLKLYHEVQQDYLIQKTGISKELAIRIVSTAVMESERYDINPNRILAFIIVESWCNPEAVSHKEAIGLMQILPLTGEFISKASGFKWSGVEELRIVESNIAYGVWYYHHLLQMFGGSEHAAISAYNWGPENIANRLSLGEKLPRVYPGKVLATESELERSIRNEHELRFRRGLDQYIHSERERGSTARSESGDRGNRLPVDAE